MNSECWSFDIPHEYSLWKDLSAGTTMFDIVTLTLKFDQFLKKTFNLAYIFWTGIARALIFHMIIPCDKTFSWFDYFLPCDLDLGIWPILLKTLTLLFIDISQEYSLW